MTMLGVGVSLVIFWIIRQFARPAPKTMNAQWQEMSNEYLRVCLPPSAGMPQALVYIFAFFELDIDIMSPLLEPKSRTHHWCIIRRIQRFRNGAKQATEGGSSER